MSIDLRAGFIFRPTDRQGSTTPNAFIGSAVANRLKKYMSEPSISEGKTVHSFRSDCSVTMALLTFPLSFLFARHGLVVKREYWMNTRLIVKTDGEEYD
eukprot:gene5858-6551_t